MPYFEKFQVKTSAIIQIDFPRTGLLPKDLTLYRENITTVNEVLPLPGDYDIVFVILLRSCLLIGEWKPKTISSVQRTGEIL